MKSIFTNKSVKPTEQELEQALGSTFPLWQALINYTQTLYPEPVQEWNYSGDKYGWSFRLKDTKRVIVYLLPRDKFFKVALVFGQKATDKILESSLSEAIKTELAAAKPYAEGRGIRIDVRNNTILPDLEQLIAIKIQG